MREYIYKKRKWLRLVKVMDALGETLIRPLLHQPGSLPQPEAVKKILVMKLDHAGDLLLSTPSLRLLRKLFVNARITLVVGPWGKELMDGCPYIDHLIVYLPDWLKQDGDKKINGPRTWKLIRFLRKERYDLFFELRGDFILIALGFAGKIPCRIGFGVAGGGWLLTHEAPLEREKHQTEIMLSPVTRFFPPPFTPDFTPDLFLRPAERRWARQWLEQKETGKPLIAIHTGAGYPSKRWGTDRYARLIGRLIRETGVRVLLVGGKGEEQAMQKNLPEGVLSAVGQSGIRQTAALLERCRLFVGNDSAPAHLAAAVHTQVIVLFSSANSSRRWAPYGKRVTVISKEKEVSCAGCERSSCEHMRCMELISVDEVLAAIRKLLSQKIPVQ
ncbi:MAG: glycosyltransferase family 9 protein [bacterium]